MDPALRHLRALVTLADQGTFTAAAAAMHISQPALTRTIQQLERMVGQDLVARTSRSLTLTERGDVFVEHSRRILADLDVAVDEMRRTPVLRVGFAWLLPAWFGVAARQFESEGGQIEIRRSDDPVAAVATGEVDVAVSRRDVDDTPGLRTRNVAAEARVVALCATSELATRADLHWDDLVSEPVIVNVASGTTRADSWGRPDPDRTVVRCNNFDEWLELTAAGRGVSAAPDLVVERISHPGVAFRRIPGVPPSAISFVWRDGHVRGTSIDRLLRAVDDAVSS